MPSITRWAPPRHPGSRRSGLVGEWWVGQSASAVAVRRFVDSVAHRSETVMVTGETGTGKELIARQVHERSGRRGRLVDFNCATFIGERGTKGTRAGASEALDEALDGALDGGLDGGLDGALEGARSELPGLFLAARGGTLLLDYVDEMPPAMQAELLLALQAGPAPRGGGAGPDVRLISNCSRDLLGLVRSGRFLAELYEKLAQARLILAPLRERHQDLPEITAHLLGRCEANGRKLTPALAGALREHTWPMNVRELFNVLSIAVISSRADAPLALDPEVQYALSGSAL